MLIGAELNGKDDDAGVDPTETPPSGADRIDVDRLVWDPEYRRRIRELLKITEAPEDNGKRRGSARFGDWLGERERSP